MKNNIIIGICCFVSITVLVICVVFYKSHIKESAPIYVQEKWESVLEFGPYLYVPIYAESGMKVRDNVNSNLDMIAITINDLKLRIEVLESKK